MFLDETTAAGNESVANIYVMVEDGRDLSEHYLGLVSMKSAEHFYKATMDLYVT